MRSMEGSQASKNAISFSKYEAESEKSAEYGGCAIQAFISKRSFVVTDLIISHPKKKSNKKENFHTNETGRKRQKTIKSKQTKRERDRKENKTRSWLLCVKFLLRRQRRHGKAITQNKNDKGEITTEKVAI